MANITSVGIGSGVLTSDLIDKLATAEREPTELRLDRREEEINAKLSAFGRLKSAITELRLPARTLGNPAAMQELTLTSSNTAIAGALSSSAKAGTYSLEVTNLAKSHAISSGTYADKDTTQVGSGTLNIVVGSASANITINTANNTLEGIAEAINAKTELNVTASVVDNGSGFQLVVSSNETGADSEIEINVTDADLDDTNASGLSVLAFNGTAQNMTESVAAENAAMKFNGISISRSSNTVTDLIDGVTLTLNSKNVDSPATIKITQDSGKVADRVEEFVDKFNELKTIITELTAYDPDDPSNSGILLGDSTLRTMNQQLRSLLSTVVPGLEDASVRSLVDVGITTNKDTGVVEFNRSTFLEKFSAYPDDVTALFSEQGRTSDSQVDFVTKSINTEPGSYDINITQIATHGAFTGTKDISAGVTIGATNDTFKLKIDGTESNDIVLTGALYTASELVAHMQAQIDADTNLQAAGKSLVVSLDSSNQLVLTSTTFGSTSKVDFSAVGGTTLADLGIDAIVGTDGVDVAGTINGQTASGAGQQLALTGTDDAAGIVVDITGGATGDRGTVTVIEGIGDRFVDLFSSYLSVDGSITTRTDGFGKQLAEISEQRAKLDERVTSMRDRLILQFTAADILVNRLNSTMDFIGRQLSALEGTSSGKN
jgi:flagellar hook-associated protein 2